jgi:hypothetical protein
MREDEKFVAESMSRHFNGSWKPVKKDPPDFFLTIEERQIAVEVTGIFEQVPISKTKRQPRHTMDSAVVAMCDRLNRSLKAHVPIPMTVILMPTVPLRDFSRCEKRIGDVIKHGVLELRDREEAVNVLGNTIRIHYSLTHRASGKKIVGLVANSLASSDILENARVALDRCLAAKNISCQSLPYRPLWLALWNDYWLASESTVAEAMKLSRVSHPFDAVLLISGNGGVRCIEGRT